MTGRTLLVGTDLSEGGMRAADIAAAVARDLDLGLCLVHAYAGLPSLDPGLVGSTLHAAEALRTRLEAEHDALVVALGAEKARLVAAGAEVDSARLVQGSPQEVLINEGLGLQAQLIAVGPHVKRGGPLDRFFGTTAAHVLLHAACPVLVAPVTPRPAEGHEGRLRGKVIMVGIDGGAAGMAALLQAVQFAAKASASVEGIYVGDDPHVVERTMSELQARARDVAGDVALDTVLRGVRAVSNPIETPVASALLSTATNASAALVMMGTHAPQGLARVVLGSVADEVCRHASLPVVVVRATDAG